MPPRPMIPNLSPGMTDIIGLNDPLSSATNALSRSASSSSQYQAVDYTDLIENAREQAQRNADRDYQLKKREVDQQYQIAKLNAKTQRERNAIDKWYNEQHVAIARERLAQEDRHFQQEHALNQARLGYDVLGMQANLRGPENYYQAAEFARGVAAQPGTATFLGALRDNTNLAGYGAQAGIPDKVSLNSLSAKMGGPNIIPGTGTPSTAAATNDDANLSAIRGIASAGAHKLGAGALEQLTDTELKLLQSGLDYIGVDTPTFMQQYARSRIGQGTGSSYRAA